MISTLWHELDEERPSFSVPSNRHQTLLSKSIFEHCIDYPQVAVIAMSSKSIQNSSLSANFAANVIITTASVPLFLSVFHPASSAPIQFCPQIHVRIDGAGAIHEFIDALVGDTPHFHKSLRSVKLDSFVNSANFTNFFLRDPARAFYNLESIELEDCVVTSDDVDRIFNNPQLLPSLKSVAEKSHAPTGESISAICSIKNLTSFRLLFAFFNFTSSTSEGIFKDLAKTNKDNLTTLALQGFHLHSANSAEHMQLNLGELTSLTSLSLSGSDIVVRDYFSSHRKLDEDGKEKLAGLTQLTSLNISHGEKFVDNSTLEMIPKCFSRLQHLELNFSSNFSDSGVEKLLENDDFAEQLSTLCLNEPVITDDCVEKDLIKCVNCTKLELGSCMELTNVSLIAVARSMKNLCHLQFGNNEIINDHGLRSIFENLKQLSYLSVSFCPRIEFKNVVEDDENCDEGFPSLDELSISDCKQIGDESMNHICTVLRPKNITILDISANDIITSKGFAQIGRAFPKLKALYCMGLCNVDDDAFIEVVAKLPMLNCLRVDSCAKITDRFLEESIPALKRLKILCVEGCPNVTKRAQKILNMHCSIPHFAPMEDDNDEYDE